MLQLRAAAVAFFGVVVPEEAQLRRHLDAVAARIARIHRHAGRGILAHRGGGALDLRDVVVELLVTAAQHHSPFVVRAEGAPGRKGEAQRRAVVPNVAILFVDAVGGEAVEERTPRIERAARFDVDDAADRIGVILRRHRLDDLDPACHHGGDDVERHRAPALVYRGDDRAVDGGAVVSRLEPAQHREARLALILLHRHAGYAAQRGGGVVIGQLADVVGRDRVDHCKGVALGRDRLALGAALPGDDQVLGGRLAFTTGHRIACGGVLRRCRGADGDANEEAGDGAEPRSMMSHDDPPILDGMVGSAHT